MDNLIFLDDLSEEIIQEQLKLRYNARQIYVGFFFFLPFLTFFLLLRWFFFVNPPLIFIDRPSPPPLFFFSEIMR